MKYKRGISGLFVTFLLIAIAVAGGWFLYSMMSSQTTSAIENTWTTIVTSYCSTAQIDPACSYCQIPTSSRCIEELINSEYFMDSNKYKICPNANLVNWLEKRLEGSGVSLDCP